MSSSTSYHANIDIPYGEHGRIITDRITRTRSRHTLEISSGDEQTKLRVRQYRTLMLQELQKVAVDPAGVWNTLEATRLIQKFLKLVTILADAKALAFPHEIGKIVQSSEEARSPSAGDKPGTRSVKSKDETGNDCDVVQQALDCDEQYQVPTLENGNSQSTSDSNKSEATSTHVPQHLLESTTHPLTVALMAYHFGGPINAAYTARRHWRQCSQSSSVSVDDFHVEGGTCEAFNDVRVTIVWEERDHTTSRPSGRHDVFLTGDATPFPLVTSTSEDNEGRVAPLVIMYDSGAATLYYDCQIPEIQRHSVSLDFHYNTIPDDTLQLLSNDIDKHDTEQLTLTTLITNFPVVSYTAHFQRLLFNKDTMAAILEKLSKLQIPMAPPTTDRSDYQIMSRFQNYNNDNVNHIPLAVSSVPFDIPVVGSYDSPMSFLDSVCIKARRDIHRPLGHSLFPQNVMDQRREEARKVIRDLTEELISSQLANYANVLVSKSYTSSDLLETSTIHDLAKRMERYCLQLVAFGFVDHAVDMSSMAALASAFGAAINGVKEIHVTPEPWVEEVDLLMFRTRCLYLFWCVDWFLCYLVHPTEGSFMLLDARKLSGHLVTVRREMIQTAHLLLRNWVAWGMFMEGLPQGGFFVRQSAGFGKWKFGP